LDSLHSPSFQKKVIKNLCIPFLNGADVVVKKISAFHLTQILLKGQLLVLSLQMLPANGNGVEKIG